MADKPSVVQTFTSEAGGVYQLLHRPGSAAPWGIVVDGEIQSTYDDYGDALRAWQEALGGAE